MKTPLHLWLIGVASLLWNAMGAVDYVMTQTRNAAYLSQFTPEQLAWFTSFPTWTTATWALAVWGSVAGSVALLLRHRVAVALFALSLVCMGLTALHNFVLAEVPMSQIVGAGALWFTLAIFLVALLLWIYAGAMRRRGVLR